MASYEGDSRPESDSFDPFQNVRSQNYNDSMDNQFTRPQPQPQQQRQQQQSKANHPFSRDFIDSLFTVVNKDLLYCKLFYFFFFGAFGSLFPLLAIYFKQLGMNASQSGVLIGFRPFIEFVAAPFWAGFADKWRRGKEMLLFAILCWVVFTLAIAFVQPPAHKCLTFNGTHNVLEVPMGRRRRHVPLDNDFQISDNLNRFNPTTTYINRVALRPDLFKYHHKSPDSLLHSTQLKHAKNYVNQNHNLPQKDPNIKGYTTSILTPASTIDHRFTTRPPIVLPDDLTPLFHISRFRRSPYKIDPNKIVNANASDIRGLIFNQHSTVVYQESQVQNAFFILLLLVIVGEFFSSPAITFADSVTLSFLGDDTQNYGRQRMFGSIGWGLAMFFVGMALDHSTAFPNHPCGSKHPSEKNYTVCFAVFCVLMCCAFLTALQFRFDHHSKAVKLSEIPGKVKDNVKRILSGHRKIDRERLVEEYDDDFPPRRQSQGDGGGRQIQGDGGGYQDMDAPAGNNKMKINPGAGTDMVTDALKAPGAKPGRGFGAVSGAVPFGSAEASYSDQPFFFKWFAVMKLLATYQYISVLFIAWYMGFGIGIIFTFLFWHLQDLGGSPTLFGVASVINHISELLAYFMTGNMLLKYGHVKILYAGLAGNIARFFYISLLSNPWWILPFEFVQGLTHAAVWAACCAFITNAIPVELRSSAQGALQGLHHGLGRGCGAVFGGLLVYQYGSVVTFRIYAVVCILVLASYIGINFYLQTQGKFSHGPSQFPQETVEDTSHLAPHGVPSGMARDLSSSRLAGDTQQEYGAMSYDGQSTLPVKAPRTSVQGQHEENPMHHGYNQGSSDRITMFEPPRLPTHIYQQQSSNNYDQGYGP